jgi:hypothetical protein
VAQVQALQAERLRGERDEDRHRAEHQRRGRRGRQAHRVGERKLVQPDAERGSAHHQPDVGAVHAQRPLAAERERGEDGGAEREADRGV